jgi:hypothetical protein
LVDRHRDEIYSERPPGALLEAARRYCDPGIDDDALRDAIHFLPDVLARARELRRGLLTLARSQI